MATIDTRVSQNGKTTYRARARLKGYPQETASFSRKTDARKWAESVESAMREGRYFTTNEAKRHTLAEMVERYERDILPLKPKNARAKRLQLAWWKTQLGDYRLSDVTPAKIVECRDRLLNVPKPNGKVRSNSTTVRYLAVLSHAFSVAMKEWGWVAANPLRNVSKPVEPRGRVRFLDKDECSRLLDACRASRSEALYTIVVLALTTGMRRGEIMGLRWRDIDFDARMFDATSNKKRRAARNPSCRPSSSAVAGTSSRSSGRLQNWCFQVDHQDARLNSRGPGSEHSSVRQFMIFGSTICGTPLRPTWPCRDARRWSSPKSSATRHCRW